MKMKYIVSHEEWYNRNNPNKIADREIMIGDYSSDGDRGFGEFAIRWISVAGEPIARLEVFRDAWALLDRCHALISALATIEKSDATPDRVIALLESLGYEDITKRNASDSPCAHEEKKPACPKRCPMYKHRNNE